MGRMQMKAKGKGISGSSLPYKRKAPKWITMTPSAVSELIVKLAKKGIFLILYKTLTFSSVSYRIEPKSDWCAFKRSTRYSSSQIFDWKKNFKNFEEKWYYYYMNKR